MKVKELFQQDPTSWQIANEGVSSNNDDNLETLRYELRTFVCEGEYHTGLVKILKGYLGSLGKDQKAAWVSGFYGSGKSHLVKVLRYLWTDYPLGEGQSARTVATLPDDVRELLRELDTEAVRHAGLHSAGGTLKAGIGSVRLRLLGILLQSVGLPEKVSIAKLRLDLTGDGTLEAIEEAIRLKGKKPEVELERPYTSSAFQKAYLAAYPNLGTTAQVGEAMLAQYPANVADISKNEMLDLIRRALTKEKGLPCTVVVLDEVQQFIGDDPNTANEVQEVVEACSKELDGLVLFVGTGQAALSATPALQKLMGRFTTKVHLKDNDVERVVRTVVLRKKEDKRSVIEAVVQKHSGEITRQLKATSLRAQSDDDKAYVADYPILPVRRRFWEAVLHSIDPTGTAAQMRTQLRVTHEACRALANEDVGAVVPADFLFDQLVTELVTSGEMQKRFQEIVDEQKSKTDGILRSRLCGLVFLINKLPREGTDSGVRATQEHLADLLTNDLGSSATAIRERLPVLLAVLRDEGVLMEVDNEFRLQTTQGAEWENEYRRQRASKINNEPELAAQRSQQLSAAVQKQLANVTHQHGQAKTTRKVRIHQGIEAPGTGATDDITVWVRDGFQEAESAVIQDVQRRSVEDATIHVLIPKLNADDLKQHLAGMMAADATLSRMGQPTGREGQEARASMVSRRAGDMSRVANAIDEIIAGARVFLSGGQQIAGDNVKSAVSEAAGQVITRLYPRFDKADNPNWGTVWKKAKDGGANALSAVSYSGDPDKHPVAAEVMQYIGAGKRGIEVVSHFTSSPYGWPKDAIDATLAVLLVSGHLTAKIQGKSVGMSDLDQRKIGQADFRVQNPVLTTKDLLKVRTLFLALGHAFKPGEEAMAAAGFVSALRAHAHAAGGEPPTPVAPSLSEFAGFEGLSGNELLFALHAEEESLRGRIATWKEVAQQVAQRLPAFQLTERLCSHAAGLEGASECASALSAIRANRSLLIDPDPVGPVLSAIASALRAALTSAYGEYGATLAAERTNLDAHPSWAKLSASQREAFLARAEIVELAAPSMKGDSDLAAALDSRSLAGWRTETAALKARFAEALKAAIKESEPKAQHLTLPSATLKNEAELDAWLGQVRGAVVAALPSGPVIL